MCPDIQAHKSCKNEALYCGLGNLSLFILVAYSSGSRVGMNVFWLIRLVVCSVDFVKSCILQFYLLGLVSSFSFCTYLNSYPGQQLKYLELFIQRSYKFPFLSRIRCKLCLKLNPQLGYFYFFNATNCSCFNYLLCGDQLIASYNLSMIFLGKKELVNLFLPELGHLVTEANICCALRQEVRLLLGEENTDTCAHKCV